MSIADLSCRRIMDTICTPPQDCDEGGDAASIQQGHCSPSALVQHRRVVHIILSVPHAGHDTSVDQRHHDRTAESFANILVKQFQTKVQQLQQEQFDHHTATPSRPFAGATAYHTHMHVGRICRNKVDYNRSIARETTWRRRLNDLLFCATDQHRHYTGSSGITTNVMMHTNAPKEDHVVTFLLDIHSYCPDDATCAYVPPCAPECHVIIYESDNITPEHSTYALWQSISNTITPADQESTTANSKDEQSTGDSQNAACRAQIVPGSDLNDIVAHARQVYALHSKEAPPSSCPTKLVSCVVTLNETNNDKMNLTISDGIVKWIMDTV